MAGARRKAKADADAQQPAHDVADAVPVPAPVAVAQPAVRVPIAAGERVSFTTVAGVVCEAVVVRVDWMNGIELRVRKPSGMTFITFADEGEGPDTFQREA